MVWFDFLPYNLKINRHGNLRKYSNLVEKGNSDSEIIGIGRMYTSQ